MVKGGSSEAPRDALDSSKEMLKPLRDLIVVEHVQETQVRGIHLPAMALDYFNTGGPKTYRVVAVGPGRTTRKGKFVPSEIAPGDKLIVYSPTTGPELMDDGKFLIRDLSMVLAVIPVQRTPPAVPS